MNERIKELERQATETVKCGLNGTSTTESFNRKKFSELIVQDCIDIISPYTVKMNRPGEEYLHPIQEIKKHFGVK